MAERKAILIVMIGMPGTGKSYSMKQLAQINKRNLFLPSNAMDDMFTKGDWPMMMPEFGWADNPDTENGKPRIKRWDLKGMNEFTGNRVLDLSAFRGDRDRSSFLDSISNTRSCFLNGGLFIDDFKSYIPARGLLSYPVATLFRERRHRMVDIFLACHDWNEINAEIISMGAEFLVKATKTKPRGAALEKIYNSDELMDVIDRVNRKSRETHIDPLNQYYCERFFPNT